MAQPRASRKKKPVVVSSSDQDEEYSPPPKRAKRGSTLMTASTIETRKDAKPATARKRRISPSSPSSTTSSKRAATKSPAKPKPSFKPITSFFHKAPLQPQSNHPTPSPEKSGASTPRVHVDDIIDSSDDDDRPVQPTKRQTSLPLRKGKDVVSTSADTLPKNSQKFRRTRPGASEPGVDGRPWNERFGPSSTSELAVHKKKVEAVRDWLAGVLGGKGRKRLLLLKGPAGSGKTTTLSLVSKEMGIHVHEWKNPTSSLPSSDGLRSATAQFEEFVGRTGAFGSLAFEGNGQSHQQVTPSTQSGRQKQLVLVEEFPNTFTRGSSIIQSFRSSVLNYLAAATPSATSFFAGKANDQPITPVVMIISETLLSTNTASADSFTAHRLLGPDILTHQSVTVVDFNPIAPTFMTKALDLVISKEARKSGRTKTVGPQVIQHLTELGDIRSAISSLEFLCLRGDEGDYSAKIQPSKAKKQKDIAMTKMEQDSLLMVTQRESTLGIFHAVGRVVYNKRLPSNPSEPVPQPPPYFPDRRRPQAPEADADALINELGTDTDTFVAALHENYVLSTDAGDSEETLDCINGCIDALSDADLLSPDRFGRSGRNVQGSGADNLRQDEMSFQTSVRGLLYSLPNPVKRIAPPPGVKGTRAKSVNGAGTDRGATNGSAFVMYYPASLRLWRQQEETNGLLEMWISRAQRGDLLVPSTTTSTPSVAGGVDTWRKTTTPFSKPTSSAPPSSSPDTPSPILLGSGTSARTEMLLERLPYLTRILSQHTKPIPRHRSHHQPLSSPSPAITTVIREIQKITTFHGPAAPLGDDEDVNGAGDEVAAALSDAEQWTTDRPGYATPRKKKKAGVWAKKDGGDVGMESAVPGTAGAKEDGGAGGVLSDDDIED